MQHRFWTLALVGLSGCSEYKVSGSPPEPELAVPVIAVDPLAIDFGEVLPGEHPEHPFTITNLGDAALHLEALAVMGQSFALGLDPSGLSLSPGERAEGSVVFQEGSGEQFGRLEIPSNDPVTPSAGIDLRALPHYPGLIIEPDPLDFGVVEVGTDAVASVELINLSDEPLELLGASVGEPFWLGQIEPITLPGGASQSLRVHFSPLEPVPYVDSLVISVGGLGEVSAAVLGAGNSTPTAVCEAVPMSPIVPLETVTFVGSGSSDPAGRPLTYSWSLVSAPAGSTAALPAGPGPDLEGFVPDELGLYTAELVVTNDLGASDTCQVQIEAVDIKPVAQCSVSPNPAMPLTDLITWSGSGSSDPAGGPLTYSWSLVAQPSGSVAAMPAGPPNSADRTNFVADMAGIYTGQLVVTNQNGTQSDPCLVNLEVVPGEDLWVEMFWSNSGEDMDLHLVRGNGSLRTNRDCYYANCVGGLSWGAAGTADDPYLDLDDIAGTGPENINISNPENLVYHVWVHDYPGSVRNAATDVTVNIYLAGLLVWTDTQSISGEDTDTWFADIDWATLTVTP